MNLPGISMDKFLCRCAESIEEINFLSAISARLFILKFGVDIFFQFRYFKVNHLIYKGGKMREEKELRRMKIDYLKMIIDYLKMVVDDLYLGNERALRLLKASIE